MDCAQCGRELTAGARFCRHCGAAVTADPAPAGKACPSCGTTAKPGARFCAKCGNDLLAAAPAAVSELPPALAPEAEEKAEPVPPEPAADPAPHSSSPETLPVPVASSSRQNAMIMGVGLVVIAAGIAAAWYLLRPVADAGRQPPPVAVSAPAPATTATKPSPSPAPGLAAKPTPRPAPPKPPAGHDEWSGDDPPAMPSIQIAPSVGGPRTPDELYRRRVQSECDAGLPGFACREKVRFEVCKNRWNDGGDRLATICATSHSNRY